MSKRTPTKKTLAGVAKLRVDKVTRFSELAGGGHDFLNTLVQCGVEMPEECCAVELKLPVDGLMQVVYTCNVTGALAHKIGKAMQVQAVKDRLRK